MVHLCVSFFYPSLDSVYTFVYIRILLWRRLMLLSKLIFFWSTWTFVIYHFGAKRYIHMVHKIQIKKRIRSLLTQRYNDAFVTLCFYIPIKYNWNCACVGGSAHCLVRLCIQGQAIFLFFRIKFNCMLHAVSSHFFGQCTISVGQEFWLFYIQTKQSTLLNTYLFVKLKCYLIYILIPLFRKLMIYLTKYYLSTAIVNHLTLM